MPAHNTPALVMQALESILDCRDVDGVEICVSDNSGHGRTREAVEAHARIRDRVTYRDSGDAPSMDENFLAAVNMASHEYVWIFGDDDLAERDALVRINEVIATTAPGIIIVNSRSFNGDETIEDKRVLQDEDVHYGPDDNDAFLKDLAGYMTFVSSIVIKKSIWDAVDKTSWMGTSFVHVATVLAAKVGRDAVFLSAPVIRMRVGSQTWSREFFRLWQVEYPRVIWGVDPVYSDSARAAVIARQPLGSLRRMAVMRAYGYLDGTAVRRFVLKNPELGLFEQFRTASLCLVPVNVLRSLYVVVITLGLRKRHRQFSPELALRWLRRSSVAMKESTGGAVGR